MAIGSRQEALSSAVVHTSQADSPSNEHAAGETVGTSGGTTGGGGRKGAAGTTEGSRSGTLPRGVPGKLTHTNRRSPPQRNASARSLRGCSSGVTSGSRGGGGRQGAGGIMGGSRSGTLPRGVPAKRTHTPQRAQPQRVASARSRRGCGHVNAAAVKLRRFTCRWERSSGRRSAVKLQRFTAGGNAAQRHVKLRRFTACLRSPAVKLRR